MPSDDVLNSNGQPGQPDDPTPEATGVARLIGGKRTLRRRILALVAALNIVSTIVACGIAYKFQKEAFIHGLDRVLVAGAVGAQHAFGDDYQDRVLKGEEFSPEEELAHLQRISKLAGKLDLNYVGALIRRDGKHYYSITSSPDHEFEDGTYDRVWTEYDDITPALTASFSDGKTRFEEHSDKYGSFRSAYVPFKMKGSDKVDYLYVADIGLDYIYGHLHRTLAKTFVAGLVITAVSLVLTLVLASHIAAPMAKLAALIRSVVRQDFRMQPGQHDTLQVIAKESHEEVAEVADSFCRMEVRLQEYFTELKQSVAERQRMESELGIAHDIQIGLLPSKLPELAGCDCFAKVIPAKEVGGDLFDIAELPDGRLLLVVADVSGKGIPASLFMAVAKTLLNVARENCSRPDEILEFLNDQLSAHNDVFMFVTMFLALLDPETGEMHYSNAGHNPPYIRKRDGKIVSLAGKHGMALGIGAGAKFPCATVTLEPGDLAMLYSDGITEAQDITESLYSENRLEDCLRDGPSTSAGEAATYLLDRVAEFQGAAPQADDITVLALKFAAHEAQGTKAGASALSPESKEVANSLPV